MNRDNVIQHAVGHPQPFARAQNFFVVNGKNGIVLDGMAADLLAAANNTSHRG